MADENYQYNVPQQENHENTYYQNVDMQPAPPQEEKANIGLAILSYLIPIVGLVLYLTQQAEKPKTAKACGKAALASVIINMVLVIAMYAIMGAAMFSAMM